MADRIVYDGPSVWRIGRCRGCRQPIHFLNAEVIVAVDNAGMSYHRECAPPAEVPDE